MIIGVGGRLFTDALCEALNMQGKAGRGREARKIPAGFGDEALINETMERTTEHVASEIHRQLGFFWSAANTAQQLEAIYLSGGGGEIKGLIPKAPPKIKTGIPVERIDPFRGIDTSNGFDSEFLREISSQMVTCVGLALRRFGDKPVASVQQ